MSELKPFFWTCTRSDLTGGGFIVFQTMWRDIDWTSVKCPRCKKPFEKEIFNKTKMSVLDGKRYYFCTAPCDDRVLLRAFF